MKNREVSKGVLGNGAGSTDCHPEYQEYGGTHYPFGTGTTIQYRAPPDGEGEGNS
jgi:hypothetical protein